MVETGRTHARSQNPREESDEAHIMALAASIRERWLMPPIVVRPQEKVVGQKSRSIFGGGENIVDAKEVDTFNHKGLDVLS